MLELCAVADAYVNNGNPGSNFGLADLRAGYGEGQNEPFASRALVRFDLSFIPRGSDIRQARFEAGQKAAGGQAVVQLPLYAVRGSWDEMSVTWNNQPPISSQPAAVIPVDSGVPVIFTWDVRNLVQEWVDGGLENNGLELRGPEGGVMWQRVYESRHYSPFCPRLVLEVVPASPMPTPTPLPSPTPTATATPVCPHPDAAGNTFAQAASLVPSKETAEYLCPSGDRDYWKFPVEAGQEIKLNLWGMTGDYDLALIDPNGALVKESALWGAGKSEYIYHLSYQTGEFRAVVSGKGVADWHPTQPYKLRVDLPFKCFEPDEAGNTFATAETILPSLPQGNIQRPLTGTICPEGDIDFYQFYVPGGQTVTIRVDLTGLPANYDLTLHDPSGKVAGQSANSGQTAERIDHIAANQPGYWRVSVFGPRQSDGGYPYHSAAYKLDVKLSSHADLTVRGIEITQAIQHLDNRLTLAAGKLTMARVYVDGGVVPGPLSGVEVKLTAWRLVWGVLQPLPGEVMMRVDNLSLLDLHPSRLDSTAGVNLFLPPEWIKAGELRLKAEVNPVRSVPETDFRNNSATATARFHGVQPINLGIVAVQANSMAINPQTDPDVVNMLAWTRQVYPTSSINVFYLANTGITANHNYNFPNPPDGTCGDGWSALLSQLENIYDDWPNRPGNAIVFGVMNALVPPGGAVGCGRVGEGVSAEIVGSNSGPVLAHEMGHNYGRAHVNACLPAGASWDHGYPTYQDPQGNPYPSGSIGEVGINTVDWTLYNPSASCDFMSYCMTGSWISPYTWHNLIYRMPDTPLEVLPRAAIPYIVISGRVRGGAVTFDPFWVQDKPAGSSDEPSDGLYSIRLLNAQGQVVGERSFSIEEPPVPLNHDTGHFREWLPYPAQTVTIALFKGSQKLAERAVSPNSPQVKVLSPNGGEEWIGKGPYTVRWQATDADGHPLTAKVLYSADGGTTWQPLVVDLGSTQVTLDTTYLPGSERAKIKVVVTDGVRTKSDQSDGVFQVDNKPPLVFLLNPRDGTSYHPGAMVVLQALATDPEDGPLPDEILTWSLPGGTRRQAAGNDVVLEGIPAGDHVIAVTARDEQGLETRREITISVGWRLFMPAVANP
jgi:hypothetical protein